MHELFYYATAMAKLRPDAKFSFDEGSYEGMNWNDETLPPSKEELELEVQRLRDQHNSTEYQRLRVKDYPSIGDQLDALFHAGVFPPEMAAKIQAIKDKYPKGS